MSVRRKHYSAVIIGGGAAGFFAAIKSAEADPKDGVLLLEKTQKLLSKVKISGGGRCNVTHFCFDPSELVKYYPRGSKELRGPFARFQPKDTIAWFENRGVKIKAEPDGRMFPISDDSQSIIDCLVHAAANVEIQCGKSVASLVKEGEYFRITLKEGEEITSDAVMLATGSMSAGHVLAQSFGHTIVQPVPSLFTFNIPSSQLHELAGVSVDPVVVSLPDFRAHYSGPLLITHWGFSGPAVLKLSAFCARELHEAGYCARCKIDWIPEVSDAKFRELVSKKKTDFPQKNLVNDSIVKLPKQLWKAIMAFLEIDDDLRWINLSKVQMEKMIQKIKHDSYEIEGKTTFKQEFVTCGGIKLSEVNFQTMESKKTPGLFFGGEILDVDGITGGFNFQAAWTTGWIAGESIGKRGCAR